MTKAAPMQTSFNAGEFSPLLEGHINLEKWADSGLLVQNLIPLKQGPLMRRGGTKFVKEVKNSANNTVLIPFQFNVEQAYIIEAGDTYFRFYKDNANITSGGNPYEITSPYSSSDLMDANYLKKFQTAQSADVLFITHGDYETRAVARASDTNWSVTAMEFVDGPYLPENDTTTTLTLSGTSGSVTVTASAVTGINNDTGFQTTDVGRLIRFKDPANNWTWLEITARASTTSVTATIKGENASAGTATTSWRLGVYSETTGYPTVITFFQDRVFLAGAASYPDRWDMTRTGGYSATQFQFAPTDRDGTVTDDAAINGTLQSGRVNSIQWANADNRGLIVGTAGREWLISPSASNEVLTPTNAKADPVSSIGSAYIQPIAIESGTVFMQRARRRMHDVVYSFDRDQLKPRDVTVASEHITSTGVSEMVYQQEPINNIWMRRTDGLLIGMTYYPDEAVFAAHRHVIGGTDVKVRSIAVIPSADETRDELWLIVERTIDGGTVKYIEYMTRYYEDDIDREDIFHVDSGLTYDSTATATVTGLGHLEGETVKVIVDGNSHPDLTVSSGSITLANDITGSVIQIGLSNTWAFKSQRIEAGARDGVAQGKKKRITGIVVRLLNTLGLYYGPDSSNTNEYDFEQGQSYDSTTALYTGDTDYLKGDWGYERDGFIYLSHDGAFPACILALMPQVTTYDR